MSMIKRKRLSYKDGRTKQAFKDSTDINKILKKAQKAGGLAHVLKYDAAVYGEFTGIDLLGAFEQCGRAQAIFADLPAEVRREFDQDAFKFAGYASDRANIGRLKELIPSIAEPEDFFSKPVVEREAELIAAAAPVVAAPVVAAPPAAPAVVEAPVEPGASSVT